eukprot:TRINITY_DN20477_c0_g1_i3.p1 TRINITY_DN20477_c0_g1~~TRINITY_DN20477_c0_g1_i3.p1  ORF type:complete len:134 (+),score=17.56 TRINITY_DN20477_c0_g1_i3:284-685(+)
MMKRCEDYAWMCSMAEHNATAETARGTRHYPQKLAQEHPTLLDVQFEGRQSQGLAWIADEVLQGGQTIDAASIAFDTAPHPIWIHNRESTAVAPWPLPFAVFCAILGTTATAMWAARWTERPSNAGSLPLLAA